MISPRCFEYSVCDFGGEQKHRLSLAKCRDFTRQPDHRDFECCRFR